MGGVYGKSWKKNACRFLVKRLLWGLVIVVILSNLCFLLAKIAPGDFVSEMELNPRISKETATALRERYGLDESLPRQYMRWLDSVARGELGYSFAYDMPVGRLVAPRIWNTLLLTVLATATAWLLALPAGAWMAWHPDGGIDRLGLAATAVLLASPQLLLGLGALLLAAATGVFPTGGMKSLDFAELSFAERFWDLAWHLTLPVAVLALGSLPVLLRHSRSAFSEVREAPFLRAARGHGIGISRLLLAYAMPATAPRLISLFGVSLAGLVSGSLLVETLLSWPGVGPLLLQAVLARDLHVVVGTTLVSAVFVIAGQILADFLLIAVDPRIGGSG